MNKFTRFIASEDNHAKFAPFLSIILGFIFGAILMFPAGSNPIEGFGAIFRGAFEGIFTGNFERLGNTLLYSTTLILGGLSVAFAFRTALFNIGVPGQIYVGGLAAVWVGTLNIGSRPLHVILSVLAAVIAGALWAFIPGLLKAKYRIHEVVTSIMMNYIALYSVKFLVEEYLIGHFDTESKTIMANASLRTSWLTNFFDGSPVNLGFFLAIITAVLFWFVLNKTTFGFELKAVGFNQNASKYAGIKVDRNMILSMMISGAIAGLAGATYYIGYQNHIKLGTIPPFFFDSIAVALLGLNTALGVVLSGLLFGMLNVGSLYLTASTSVPETLVGIIIASIIYFAATSLLFKDFLKKITKKFRGGVE